VFLARLCVPPLSNEKDKREEEENRRQITRRENGKASGFLYMNK
jgi:hypothetical protein